MNEAEMIPEVETAKDLIESPMGFGTSGWFDLIQRVAKCFAASTMVPKEFQGNVANCIIAINMANRLQRDPLMVMQSLYVVNGRPGWSAQFLIALFNESGVFAPIRFRDTGDPSNDSRGCIAWSVDQNGEAIESVEVTIAMAKADGWYSKSGSKWQSLPAQMLRYRAASMLIKVYAPGIAFGLEVDE